MSSSLILQRHLFIFYAPRSLFFPGYIALYPDITWFRCVWPGTWTWDRVHVPCSALQCSTAIFHGPKYRAVRRRSRERGHKWFFARHTLFTNPKPPRHSPDTPRTQPHNWQSNANDLWPWVNCLRDPVSPVGLAG